MKNFQLVSEAVAKMNFGGNESFMPTCETDKDTKIRYNQYELSNIDCDEDDSEDLVEYEQIYENEGCSY